MKPIFILLALFLVAPLSAVVVNYDSELCDIHYQNNVTQMDNGIIKVNISDIPTSCPLSISIIPEYTTKAVSYNVDEPKKITYSDEYYKLDNLVTKYLKNIKEISTTWSWEMDAQLASFYELRRQTILMERQNELIEEQNNLSRKQMAMKLKCISSGTFCTEYAWV